ncbi:hypothetical protein H7J86_03510 [Mycobacterium hackensackense]|uniref:hypothetical protein n=1 Tax=Mycobacterium hackensackense TaxID=228909 RepID=UPI002265E701|nr:hypothetical protein [Mycobacterium hackensackense]MCV7251219.1 hypothetical protein [Mycobacterium hackensackense]
MSSATVYVSHGATVDEVRAAVDAYLPTVGRPIETGVEFGDEYPGFAVAIDVYGANEDTVTADARQLADNLAELLPGHRFATSADLEAGVKPPLTPDL